jgi:acyl phosphate:glycerol-3-phosphate acyltransferase
LPTVIFFYLVGLLIGYVLGAFPTGFFAAKLWNVDVRKHGSGRTGGTNVLRTAGWGAFLITIIGDVAKGVIAVLIARWLFPEVHGAHAAALLGVLFGHNWSIWIALLAKPKPDTVYASPPLGWIQWISQQGRGGAGVTSSVAAAATLFPAFLIGAPIPLILLFIFRYASVASLSVAVVFVVEAFFFSIRGDTPWSYFLTAVIAGTVLVLVHIPNIQRLRTGTEKKFGQRLVDRTTPRPKSSNA